MYRIILHPKVQKDLRALSRKDEKRILDVIGTKLRDRPKTFGKPLQNDLKNYWSLRVGSHRIIYEVHEKEIVVHVIKIGKRDFVYDDIFRRIGL